MEIEGAGVHAVEADIGNQHTIIDLLQSNLCIVWKCLLSLRAQHESLWFLWCSSHGAGL